jgi:plasmid stabilization system protein ParE
MAANEPRFHPEAQAEYTAAFRWYQEQSLRAASRFESEAERVLDQIAENPDMFPKYDDDHRFALLHRFPYSVVYQVHESRIHIIAVAHASRLPGYWQDRA